MTHLPVGDAELVRIVDAAFFDAARRAGTWLACRPGCNQCCTGVFRISQLDAARLRVGLETLFVNEPTRASLLQARLAEARGRLAGSFPGDAKSGLLGSTNKAEEQFENFGNDEVCPVLEPSTGTCSLYDSRPMTCRTFGPPVLTQEDVLGTCELCFQGATEDQVRAAEMYLPPSHVEESLAAETGLNGETIVAFAFCEH